MSIYGMNIVVNLLRETLYADNYNEVLNIIRFHLDHNSIVLICKGGFGTDGLTTLIKIN